MSVLESGCVIRIWASPRTWPQNILLLYYTGTENMILSTIPADIATKEQLLVWVVSEMRMTLAAANPSAQYPKQITEAQGYFPSDIISIQEISTVDGGPRHVLRVLVPVAPAYYGASAPVYQFAGQILP